MNEFQVLASWAISVLLTFLCFFWLSIFKKKHAKSKNKTNTDQKLECSKCESVFNLEIADSQNWEYCPVCGDCFYDLYSLVLLHSWIHIQYVSDLQSNFINSQALFNV